MYSCTSGTLLASVFGMFVIARDQLNIAVPPQNFCKHFVRKIPEHAMAVLLLRMIAEMMSMVETEN